MRNSVLKMLPHHLNLETEMAKYVATHKGQPVSSVFLHDSEYKAKDGAIVIPDGHEAAHKAAAHIGLEKAE